mmetsp:Transcript_20392/g.44143  ORF Transcript_20392/g.44143 Transcript_20392/m.44143 type:complete len:140 (-) Transcript_20392:248-667(-)
MSRTYTPTATELNGAIDAVLKQKDEEKFQGLHQIQKTLEKDNPTWVLPSRRVAKFVKRQKAGNPVQDDEVASVGGSIRKMFSGKKKKSSSGTAPPTPVKEEAPAPVEEVEAPKEAAPEPVFETYVDDNDGKKEKGCWCC